MPTGTPAPVIDRLVQACQSAVSSPEIADEAQIRGFELSYAGPAEIRSLIVSDLARRGHLVQLSGVKPE